MLGSLADFLRRLLGLAALFGRGAGKAVKRGRPMSFLRPAARALRRSDQELRRELRQELAEAAGLEQPAMAWLEREAAGLEGLLDRGPFRVSILVPVEAASPPAAAALERCLASCLKQAPAELEVLVGTAAEPPAAIAAVLTRAEAEWDGRLRRVAPGDAAALVAAARYEWLLFADPAGWLRPDLLYRCHQLLSREREPGGLVISCAGWTLDGRGEVAAPPDLKTSARPHLPFAFATGDLESAALLPADRLRPATALGRPLEWALAAVAGGARLLAVPVPLCARPAPRGADAATLGRYLAACGKNWEVAEGGRIRPRLPEPWPSVAVVMPFRDQAARTRAAVAALEAQSWPGVRLVAVDNGSRDRELGRELATRGARVLRRDEPFNYSRLVNAALEGETSELVLLLNNDVELAPGALEELAAWALEEGVGLVGPALFYPDGRLQHGGLELDPAGRAGEQPWLLVERGWPESRLKAAARLRIVDAVSGACAMVRRKALVEVGGLDATFYPNAFSDTDLALRLAARGLRHIYTPYARGSHHESASRPGDRREDFEGSAWLRAHLAATENP